MRSGRAAPPHRLRAYRRNTAICRQFYAPGRIRTFRSPPICLRKCRFGGLFKPKLGSRTHCDKANEGSQARPRPRRDRQQEPIGDQCRGWPRTSWYRKRAEALVPGDHVLVPGMEGTVMVDEVERREDNVRVRLQADDRWFSLRTDELVAVMKRPG